MPKILFLDDDENRIPLLPFQYDVIYVRDFEQMKDYLEHNPIPDIISFDHDLAPAHYEIGRIPVEGEKNGQYCARWVVENGYIPTRAIVHSWNSAGAKAIAYILSDGGCKDIFVKMFNPRKRHDWKE